MHNFSKIIIAVVAILLLSSCGVQVNIGSPYYKGDDYHYYHDKAHGYKNPAQEPNNVITD